MNNIAIALGLLLLPGISLAGSTRPDTSEVIDQMAEKLFQDVKGGIGTKVTRPKVVIAEVSGITKAVPAEDIAAIADRLEAKLTGIVALLDRDKAAVIAGEQSFQQSGEVRDGDIKQLGEKYGADLLLFVAFRDKTSPVSSDAEKISLEGKITGITVLTTRKDFVKIETVAFEKTTFATSYYLRDTASFLLGTTAILAGIGAVASGGMAYDAKSKYDTAKTRNEASDYRARAERQRNIAGVSAGIGLLTLAARWKLESLPRDQREYFEYELLTISPTLDGFAITWRFP
jgi:hypothetical protein